jgi:CRP-like cAMP-binding protein
LELSEALVQLRQVMSHFQSLTDEEWEAFAAIWQPLAAKRKTVLTTIGEVEKHLYFVTSGVQRAFYLHGPEAKDATLVFTYPYSFSGIADSFLTQHPSRYYLETLTASSFLKTTYTQLQPVLQKHRSIEQAIFSMTAHVLEGVLQRQIELQCFTAEEKFRALLQRSPHVLGLIPHKYLASYLGIDAATFSRLLSSVRL